MDGGGLRSTLDDENVVTMASDNDALEQALIESLRTRHADLAALLAKHSDHWRFEDPIYRFYHQSFKVFGLQSQTKGIVGMLAQLVPGRPLNSWFTTIVERGTERTFAMGDNANWTWSPARFWKRSSTRGSSWKWRFATRNWSHRRARFRAATRRSCICTT